MNRIQTGFTGLTGFTEPGHRGGRSLDRINRIYRIRQIRDAATGQNSEFQIPNFKFRPTAGKEASPNPFPRFGSLPLPTHGSADKPFPIPHSPFRIPHSAAQRRGSSLITTLLVLVVLSTICIAFMQSMSIERSVARSGANKKKAEESAEAGLAAAMARMKAGASTNFIVAQDRSSPDSNRWPMVFIPLSASGLPVATNSLEFSSSSITNHTFTLLTNAMRVMPVYAITNDTGATNGAFSYLAIANTGKQNLFRYPAISPRVYATTLREVPLILPNLDLLTSAQSNSINSAAADLAVFSNRLFSVATANQIISPLPSPAISKLWADTATWASSLSPAGTPKIDLRRLKFYLDSLSVAQATGNPKAAVVDALLGQASSVVPETAWGGGTLEWLVSTANTGRYSLTEGRQIAANLIDYLDDDLHPTTDNIDAPTYFGVEGRFLSSGRVRGHPYVSTLGFGLVFNISQAASANGSLNSTRVLSFWSLVNPWSEAITNFHASYDVVLEIEILGQASGGNLGNEAKAYFLTPLNERLEDGPGSIPSYSGFVYPTSPSGLSFANLNSLQPNNRQPPGMTFTDIKFRIVKARLLFTDTDGRQSAVQVLDALSTKTVDMNPATFVLPTSAPPTSRVYNPGSVRNALFLSADPRINFSSNAWTTNQITTSDASSTSPPIGVNAINVFANMNATQGDGPQGVSSNTSWFSSTNLTNHFFVRSPAKLTNNPATTPYNPVASPPPAELAMESIAELGFLWTGRPWQTLRMVEPPAATPFRRDYLLLDYVDSGTMRISTNIFPTGRAAVDGKINVNAGLQPTLEGIFRAIPGLSQADASARVSDIATATTNSGYPFVGAGALGALTNLATPGATNKFAREDLIRRTANLLTTRSDYFTVLSYGEARDTRNPARVLSRANIVAVVRLIPNPDGTVTPEIVSKTIY